jgi:uncharacterized protein
MVKAPRAGRVKTRLAAAIGAVEAVRCYRAMLDRTVRRLADGRWATWLAVTPDGAAPRMEVANAGLPSCRRGRAGSGNACSG